MSTPIQKLIHLSREHIKNLDLFIIKHENSLAIDAQPEYEELLQIGASIASKVDQCLIDLNNGGEEIEIATLKEEIGKNGRDLFKKVTEIATVNSHRLRAPISRIQGLLALHDIDPDPSKEEAKKFQSELIKSLKELDKEFEQLEIIFNEIEVLLES